MEIDKVLGWLLKSNTTRVINLDLKMTINIGGVIQ